MKQNINKDFESSVKCYSTEEIKTNEIWISDDGNIHDVYIKSFKGQWVTGKTFIAISLSDIDWEEIIFPFSGYVRSTFNVFYDLNTTHVLYIGVIPKENSYLPNSLVLFSDFKDTDTEVISEYKITIKYTKTTD